MCYVLRVFAISFFRFVFFLVGSVQHIHPLKNQMFQSKKCSFLRVSLRSGCSGPRRKMKMKNSGCWWVESSILDVEVFINEYTTTTTRWMSVTYKWMHEWIYTTHKKTLGMNESAFNVLHIEEKVSGSSRQEEMWPLEET